MEGEVHGAVSEVATTHGSHKDSLCLYEKIQFFVGKRSGSLLWLTLSTAVQHILLVTLGSERIKRKSTVLYLERKENYLHMLFFSSRIYSASV